MVGVQGSIVPVQTGPQWNVDHYTCYNHHADGEHLLIVRLRSHIAESNLKFEGTEIIHT